MKFYWNYWTVTTRCQFVVYGDPSIPSHGWWIIPGTYVE